MTVKQYIENGGYVERVPSRPVPAQQTVRAAPVCMVCGYAVIQTCQCVEQKAKRFRS